MNTKLVLEKAGFVLKQASPEILIGFGILSGIAAIFTACSKMKETEAIQEDFHEEVEIVKEEEEPGTKEYNIGIVKAGAKLFGRYLKTFWLPILLEILAIIAIWYSHGIMVKRNANLVSAAIVLTQQLEKYRDRVREKVGEEVENDLFYGVTNRKVDEIIGKDEKGKDKKIKVMEKVITNGAEGPFDRVFDRNNHNYKGQPGPDMIFIQGIQRAFNDIIKDRATKTSNGWVTINEVYNQLGFPSVEEGFQWGWIYSNHDPKYMGTYIDFGINDHSNAAVRDFQNGLEPVIPLHFNCTPFMFSDLKLAKVSK